MLYQVQLLIKKPMVMIVMVTIFLVTLYALVWFPNRLLLWSLLTHTQSGVEEKIWLLLDGVWALSTAYTLFGAFVVVCASLLTALYFGLLYELTRRRVVFSRQTTAVHGYSIVGLLISMFGVGCAACGSVMVIPLVTFFGVSGVLAWLPFGGEEFGVVGIGILAYACFLLVRRLSISSTVCEVRR